MRARIRKARLARPSQLEDYREFRKELFEYDRFLFRNLDNWILVISGSVYAFYLAVAEDIETKHFHGLDHLATSLKFSFWAIVIIIFSKFLGMRIARHKIRLLNKACEESPEEEIIDQYDIKASSWFNRSIDFIANNMSYAYLICFICSLYFVLQFASSNIPVQEQGRTAEHEITTPENGGSTFSPAEATETNAQDTASTDATTPAETDGEPPQEIGLPTTRQKTPSESLQ